jgi:hypothetical protein
MELLGRLREAALSRYRRENGEVLQLHPIIIIYSYITPRVINWTIIAEAVTKGIVSGGPNEG